MKKLMLAAGLAGAAFAMGGDALACGDKLVIVGRGMRPKRVRGSVVSLEELENALGTGSYDLVFADLKAAPLVETEAKEARSKPTVLPTLFNPSDTEMAVATKE